MKLKNWEIAAIADQLDEVISNHFHDAIYNVVQREVSDEEITAIKQELRKII